MLRSFGIDDDVLGWDDETEDFVDGDLIHTVSNGIVVNYHPCKYKSLANTFYIKDCLSRYFLASFNIGFVYLSSTLKHACEDGKLCCYLRIRTVDSIHDEVYWGEMN